MQRLMKFDAVWFYDILNCFVAKKRSDSSLNYDTTHRGHKEIGATLG